MLGAHGAIGFLLKGIEADTECALVSQRSGDLTLHLVSLGRADNACIVDETIFGRVFLSLQCAEESLLGTENLNGGGWLLSKVDQAAGVRDQLGTDELTNELGEVGSDGGHTVLEVLGKVSTVVGDGNDLTGESLEMAFIISSDLSTHGDFGGLANLVGDFLGANCLEFLLGEVLHVGPHANENDRLGVDDIISDDLRELGEMPRVPLLQTHGVVVELFVEVLKKRNSLNDHSVDLIRGEGELIARHAMSQTKLHLLHLGALNAVNEALHLETDATEELIGLLAGLAVNAKLFLDGLAELVVGDEELVLNLLLNHVLAEEFLQTLEGLC